MLKRNISIYITDVTMVQLASQDLMSVLEKLGVNYSMSIETEDDIENVMAADYGGETSVMQTFKSGQLAEGGHNLATLKNPVTVIRSGVPVTAPEATSMGEVAKRIGTADVLSDGTAKVTLSEHGQSIVKSHQVVGLSITTLGPAKPAIRYDLSPGEKRDA